jgi:drug/metabolite transporter (DMT)-like permease
MYSFLPQNNLGELAALTAPFLWAGSSVIYSRLGQSITPLQLNFGKGIIAIALLLITLAWRSEPLADLRLFSVILLLISGIIGIGLGDTAYFAALNHLGARRTLLLETLSPPIGAIFALIFIQEQLSFKDWCGSLLVLIGIAWVISERNPLGDGERNLQSMGIIWAILAAISQAAGAVMSRMALLQSQMSPLASTLIRLVGGTSIVLILLLLSSPFGRGNREQVTGKSGAYRASRKLVVSSPFTTSQEGEEKDFGRGLNPCPQRQLLTLRSIGAIAIAAFGSTYLGIWLQQTALKFSPTGIAQTLLATSPLFILPLAALMGEKISSQAIGGVLIAVSGIFVLST